MLHQILLFSNFIRSINTTKIKRFINSNLHTRYTILKFKFLNSFNLFIINVKKRTILTKTTVAIRNIRRICLMTTKIKKMCITIKNKNFMQKLYSFMMKY